VSPGTALVWYENGQLIDNTYSLTNDYIENVLNYTVPTSGLSQTRLECRLSFLPLNLVLSTFSLVKIQGRSPLYFLPILLKYLTAMSKPALIFTKFNLMSILKPLGIILSTYAP